MTEDDYGYDPMRKADREARLVVRRNIARRLNAVARELATLEADWTTEDYHPDTLHAEEWPFELALEDMVARVAHSAQRIQDNNWILELEPITITVDPETWAELTTALEAPAREVPQLRALLERIRSVRD